MSTRSNNSHIDSRSSEGMGMSSSRGGTTGGAKKILSFILAAAVLYLGIQLMDPLMAALDGTAMAVGSILNAANVLLSSIAEAANSAAQQ